MMVLVPPLARNGLIQRFLKNTSTPEEGLIAKILAHDSAVRIRVIRLADAIQQQQARVGHRERAQHHHIGGLLIFNAGHQIHITHARRTPGLGVVIDAEHMRTQADFKILSLATAADTTAHPEWPLACASQMKRSQWPQY